MCFQRVALFVAFRCSGKCRSSGLDNAEAGIGVLWI